MTWRVGSLALLVICATAANAGFSCDEKDESSDDKPLVYDRLEVPVEVHGERVTICLRLSAVMRERIKRQISSERTPKDQKNVVRLGVALDVVDHRSTLGGRVFVNVPEDYDEPLTYKSHFYVGSFAWSHKGDPLQEHLEEFYLDPFPALRKLAKLKQVEANGWMRLTIEPIVRKKADVSKELRFLVVDAALTIARSRFQK